MTEPQQRRIRKEWAELIKEFPLTFFTAKEASILAKIPVNEIHKLAREGVLKRRLFQSINWIEPESLLTYILETRKLERESL